jgi:hypothetical protein
MTRASNYTTQTGDVQVMILSYIQPARILHNDMSSGEQCDGTRRTFWFQENVKL